MVIKSSKLYDVLKWIGRYALPSLTTLYVALAKVWGWDYATEITATLSAITVCLNSLLGICNSNFKDQNSVEGEL